MTSWLVPPSSEWSAPDDWPVLARRQGPLRYSDLGSRRLSPPAESVASWLAAEVDPWWEAQGAPDPFVLVVVSGDDGRLARGLLVNEPKCLPALRYVSVNPLGPPIKGVPLEAPAFLFPAAGPPGIDEEEPPPAAGVGPLFTALDDLPSLPGCTGAVVEIEFLSRMAADRYEWRDNKWYELRVALQGDQLVEIAVPAPGPPGLPPVSGRHVQPVGATGWLSAMLRCLGAGVVVALDVLHEELDQLNRVSLAEAGPVPATGDLESVIWRIA